MNTFLLDLWHDLKQKRLWPVAAVLITATLAVPVVLSKPASEGSEPSPAPGAGTQTANALPAVDVESAPASSDLEVFDPHNPFSPDKDRPRGLGGDDTGSSGSSAPDTGTSGGSKGGSDASTASTGGSSGGSGSGSSPSGSGGGGDGGGTFWFTFEIDVKFGPVGDEKREKGLKALDVLPDERNPVLVFMGMKDDTRTALFMVLDPGIEATGEGKCSPSDERCSFVELTTSENRDEVFLNSSRGEDYSLQLLRVKRVRIDQPPSDQRSTDARSSRRERNDPEPFFLPSLLARAFGGE